MKIKIDYSYTSFIGLGSGTSTFEIDQMPSIEDRNEFFLNLLKGLNPKNNYKINKVYTYVQENRNTL